MYECVIDEEKHPELINGNPVLRVEGVFSSGVYFTEENGEMLMLHDSKYGRLPFGISCGGIAGRCKDLGFYVGETVAMNNGYLGNFRLHAAEKSRNDSKVCYESFRKNLLTGLEKLMSEDKRSKISILSLKNLETVTSREIDDPFTAIGLKGLIDLELGMSAENLDAIEKGLKGILGLGTGLTPSFDDFITGILCLNNYTESCYKMHNKGIDLLRRAVKKYAEKVTNRYSACFLLNAAEGGEYTIISDVLKAADNFAFQEAALKLMSVGGSSGCDMSAGILFAVKRLPQNIRA